MTPPPRQCEELPRFIRRHRLPAVAAVNSHVPQVAHAVQNVVHPVIQVTARAKRSYGPQGRCGSSLISRQS